MDQLNETYLDEEARFTRVSLALATEIARGKGFNAVGWNALYVLFADRFGWTPTQVRSMTLEETSLMFDAFFQPKPARTKSGS